MEIIIILTPTIEFGDPNVKMIRFLYETCVCVSILSLRIRQFILFTMLFINYTFFFIGSLRLYTHYTSACDGIGREPMAHLHISFFFLSIFSYIIIINAMSHLNGMGSLGFSLHFL